MIRSASMRPIRFICAAFAITVLLLGMGVGTSSIAHALDIKSAKAQGLVGERPDGYLGAVKKDGAVVAFVNTINSKRKAKYTALAKKNNTSLQAVQKIVGNKLQTQAKKGEYVLQGNRWVRR